MSSSRLFLQLPTRSGPRLSLTTTTNLHAHPAKPPAPQLRLIHCAKRTPSQHVALIPPPPTSTQPWPVDHLPRPSTSTQDHKPGGPIDLYHDRLKAGLLKEDAHQLTVIGQLQHLYDTLADYHPPPVTAAATRSSAGWLRNLYWPVTRLLGTAGQQITSSPPQGMYLYGSVGTGKSMLMDLFYDSLPNLNRPELSAQRVHFHQFMLDIHQRNHALQQRTAEAQADVLVGIAQDIARESRVLCFDEFQVTDIVDAMILKRLLESLLAEGVVCVMTSNRHPDELYKNGLQRESFVPCIELLKAHYAVTDLNSGTDYRKQARQLSRVYFDPLNPANRAEFGKLFDALTDTEPVRTNRPLHVWGRTVAIPRSTSKVAWFDFHQLCGSPLSAADYLALVKQFEIVFVEDIPKLNLSQRDMARRFIWFLDAAYESKTKLFALSEVPIVQIFSGSGASEGVSSEMRAAMDDLGVDMQTIGGSSLFTGEDEIFAWARAVSRLTQMGTLEWSLEHRKDNGMAGAAATGVAIGASDLVKGLEDDGSVLLVQ